MTNLLAPEHLNAKRSSYRSQDKGSVEHVCGTSGCCHVCVEREGTEACRNIEESSREVLSDRGWDAGI